MPISPLNSSGSVSSVKAPSGIREPSKSISSVEIDSKHSVSISTEAQALLGAASQPEPDMAKIQALKAKISSGTYQPNPQNIAQKILQEAVQSKR